MRTWPVPGLFCFSHVSQGVCRNGSLSGVVAPVYFACSWLCSRYPKVYDALTTCTIAASVPVSLQQWEHTDGTGTAGGLASSVPSTTPTLSSAFRGQMGQIYVFDDALGVPQVEGIFSLGPGYMYSFMASESGLPRAGPASAVLSDTKDGLSSKIVVALNAQVRPRVPHLLSYPIFPRLTLSSPCFPSCAPYRHLILQHLVPFFTIFTGCRLLLVWYQRRPATSKVLVAFGCMGVQPSVVSLVLCPLAWRVSAAWVVQASMGRTLFNIAPLWEQAQAPGGDTGGAVAGIMPGVQLCYRQRVQDVINCVGGISVLFPLFTQLDQPVEGLERRGGIEPPPGRRRAFGSDDPASENSQLALDVVGLLTAVLAGNQASQQYMLNVNGFGVTNFLLQRVSPHHLSVKFVLALENLISCIANDTGERVEELGWGAWVIVCVLLIALTLLCNLCLCSW